MADVPVPGEELTPDAGLRDDPSPALPAAVRDLLETLWSAGHAGYVVGGSLRDAFLERTATDWDLATSALPEVTAALFPTAVYDNAFGMVAVPSDDPAVEEVEITTFRSDHDYADFRRPHRVEFGDSIELDLARRDFTVNAMAWGARPAELPALIDPYAGLVDVARRRLRAVGDPGARFEEDALRMVRAVRFATTLGFDIDSATMAGIERHADLVRHLSGERIAAELDKLLGAPTPSVGLRLLHETGLLAGISLELAAQRGIPQNKVAGEDLWDHTVRTVDAAAASRPIVRLAALVHDIGKPATFADGRFVGHETVGAELAGAFLDRLHAPRAVHDRVVALVRQHMFGYEPSWSDAAVRRFIGKMAAIGDGALEELLALREADNVGSGLPAGAGRIEELRARVAAERASELVLDRGGLAVDGRDLMAELAIEEGPRLGRILEDLVELVIADPALNERPTLLLLAQGMLAEDR